MRALPFALFVFSLPAFAGSPSYGELAPFKLGGDGGWDLLSASGSHVFVARGNRVMAVNAANGALEGEITGVEGAHGVAVSRKAETGFATAGKLGEVWAFDTKSLAVKAKIKAGENPDAILYDEFTDRVFCFNGKSRDVTVIDATSFKVVGTLKVDGKPELAASDNAGKIYLNLEDKSAMVELDAKKLQVLRTFALKPCEEPTGIAMNTKSHRLFVGCGNELAAVVDAKSGKVLKTLPVGDGVDGAAFDETRGLAFFPAGKEGKLTILRETKAGFEPAQELATMKSARTIALGNDGRVYLPAAELGPAPEAKPGEKPARPPVLPGTFRLLVIGPK